MLQGFSEKWKNVFIGGKKKKMCWPSTGGFEWILIWSRLFQFFKMSFAWLACQLTRRAWKMRAILTFSKTMWALQEKVRQFYCPYIMSNKFGPTWLKHLTGLSKRMLLCMPYLTVKSLCATKWKLTPINGHKYGCLSWMFSVHIVTMSRDLMAYLSNNGAVVHWPRKRWHIGHPRVAPWVYYDPLLF